jgi:hypothetical protein
MALTKWPQRIKQINNLMARLHKSNAAIITLSTDTFYLLERCLYDPELILQPTIPALQVFGLAHS